jgi:hypothetical protein
LRSALRLRPDAADALNTRLYLENFQGTPFGYNQEVETKLR